MIFAAANNECWGAGYDAYHHQYLVLIHNILTALGPGSALYLSLAYFATLRALLAVRWLRIKSLNL